MNFFCKRMAMLVCMLSLAACYTRASDIILYVGVKSGDVQKVKSAIYENANVNMEVNGKKLLVEAIDRVLAMCPHETDTYLEKARTVLSPLIGNDIGLTHAAVGTAALGCSISLIRGHVIESLLSATTFLSAVALRYQLVKKGRLEILEHLAMHPKLSRDSLLAAIHHVGDRLVKAYEQRTVMNEALLEIDRILRVAASRADAREYRKLNHQEAYG